MGMTIAEKILSKSCGRKVTPGELVYPEPDLVVATEVQLFHEGIPITEELKELGITKIAHPERYMVTLGHTAPVTSPATAETAKRVRGIVAELGIKHFFDQGQHGIEHSQVIEKGLARPGMLVYGGDTHMTMVGAVGVLGIAVCYELLTIFATGAIWIRVPSTIKVELTGSLRKGVFSRDLISWIISDIGAERGNYRVLEFTSPAINNIEIEARMTLCNVPPQIGAKSAIVTPDEKAINYVKARSNEPFEVVRSDPDASYEQVFRYDLSTLEPMVALPPNPDNVKPLTTLVGTKIHQATLGSCANGMLSDLRAAAAVLKGQRVHAGVRMVVCPATTEVYLDAVREGLIETFLSSGATINEPGCGICFGTIASLAVGEACIATITRNEPGRTGTMEADIYLASPATVAASAIKGEIADPREFL